MRSWCVVVVALVALLTSCSDDSAAPTGSPSAATTTTIQAPAPVQGRCMVPSAETLKNAAFAFDGTVAEVDKDRVVLEVSHWYTGQDADRVEVAQTPPQLRQSLGAATFTPGDRYLVAADADHRLMVCGFTAAYSSSLADLYSSAFGS